MPSLRKAVVVAVALASLAACLPQAARIELAPNEKLLISRAEIHAIIAAENSQDPEGTEP